MAGAASQTGASLDHLEQVRIADFDRSSYVPGHVNHGHYGLDVLHLVPFVALQGQLVLIGCRPKKVTKESLRAPSTTFPQQGSPPHTHPSLSRDD